MAHMLEPVPCIRNCMFKIALIALGSMISGVGQEKHADNMKSELSPSRLQAGRFQASRLQASRLQASELQTIKLPPSVP